jgi:hypothetical protein
MTPSKETLPRLGRADRRYTIRQALSSEALNCMRAQPNNVESPSHTRKPAASSCALCCAKVLISCANVALQWQNDADTSYPFADGGLARYLLELGERGRIKLNADECSWARRGPKWVIFWCAGCFNMKSIF